MKCQRQILQVEWHQFVHNDESFDEWSSHHIQLIVHHRVGVFGHIARLQDASPQGSPMSRRPDAWATTEP